MHDCYTCSGVGCMSYRYTIIEMDSSSLAIIIRVKDSLVTVTVIHTFSMSNLHVSDSDTAT